VHLSRFYPRPPFGKKNDVRRNERILIAGRSCHCQSIQLNHFVLTARHHHLLKTLVHRGGEKSQSSTIKTQRRRRNGREKTIMRSLLPVITIRDMNANTGRTTIVRGRKSGRRKDHVTRSSGLEKRWTEVVKRKVVKGKR
jgi:hypothetical protein